MSGDGGRNFGILGGRPVVWMRVGGNDDDTKGGAWSSSSGFPF